MCTSSPGGSGAPISYEQLDRLAGGVEHAVDAVGRLIRQHVLGRRAAGPAPSATGSTMRHAAHLRLERQQARAPDDERQPRRVADVEVEPPAALERAQLAVDHDVGGVVHADAEAIAAAPGHAVERPTGRRHHRVEAGQRADAVDAAERPVARRHLDAEVDVDRRRRARAQAADRARRATASPCPRAHGRAPRPRRPPVDDDGAGAHVPRVEAVGIDPVEVVVVERRRARGEALGEAPQHQLVERRAGRRWAPRCARAPRAGAPRHRRAR